MVKTKGKAAARKNWNDAIGRVPSKYAEGVSRTTDWKEKAIAGDDLYKERVIAAAQAGRRAKGIEKVSNEEWKRKAQEKGAARIGAGMNAAKEDYGRGIDRVIDTLEGIELLPRTADVDSNIDNRVKPIARALRKMKEEA